MLVPPSLRSARPLNVASRSRTGRYDRLIDSLLLPRAIVLVCVILLAGLNSLIVQQVVEGRKEALVRGDEAQTLQHRALLSQIEQTLNLYEYVVSDLAGRRDTPALNDELRRLGALDAKLLDLLVLSRDGQIQHWSGEGPPPEVADREYFTALRDDPLRRLYIGPVRSSRAHPDRWFFSLSRPVRALDGSLDSVIVAIIDLSVFNRDLAEALAVEGAGLGIIKTDGHVITRLPIVTDRPMEERVKLPADLPPVGSSPGMLKRESVSPFDKALRRQTWTYLPDHELWVITSITRDRMLSLWWSGVKDAIPLWVALNLVLIAGALAMLAASRRNLRSMRALQDLTARLETQASVDPLTGAYNRRHFLQVAEREWARCRRYAEDGALLLVDADQFKGLKGSHGGACCDALLRDMARAVTQSLRQPDLLGRYAADTLIVYLPNTDPMGALDVAERIRERLAGHTLRWHNGGVSSTVSIGVASVGATHVTLESLVQDGLSALQAAKEAGRNCVRAAPIQPRATPARPPSAASGGPRARRP